MSDSMTFEVEMVEISCSRYPYHVKSRNYLLHMAESPTCHCSY